MSKLLPQHPYRQRDEFMPRNPSLELDKKGNSQQSFLFQAWSQCSSPWCPERQGVQRQSDFLADLSANSSIPKSTIAADFLCIIQQVFNRLVPFTFYEIPQYVPGEADRGGLEAWCLSRLLCSRSKPCPARSREACDWIAYYHHWKGSGLGWVILKCCVQSGVVPPPRCFFFFYCTWTMYPSFPSNTKNNILKRCFVLKN